MDLRSLITEYFTSGVLLLTSIVLFGLSIVLDSIDVTTTLEWVRSVPASCLVPVGLVTVVLATSLGAGNNALSIALFRTIETQARREALDGMLRKAGYDALPLMRQYRDGKQGTAPDAVAGDVLSSIRAFLYDRSSDIARRLDFHRNDVRFCRGLILPHALLCVSVPGSCLLTMGHWPLSGFLAVVSFLGYAGALRAYKSRLRWMQEYSLRAYSKVCGVAPSPSTCRMAFVLVGVAGSGKTKLIRSLATRCRDLAYVPKCTTRSIREDEAFCTDYRFLNVRDFQRLEEEGEFATCKTSEFDDCKYGVLTEDLAADRDIMFSGHSLSGLKQLKAALLRLGCRKVVGIHIVTDLVASTRKLAAHDTERAQRCTVEKRLSAELATAPSDTIQYRVENPDCQLAAFGAVWEIIKYERTQLGVGHCRDYDAEVVFKHSI